MAKSTAQDITFEKLPLRGELASLVNLLAERMAIQDRQVGSDLEELKPMAGHAVKGVFNGGPQTWPCQAFKQGDDIFDPEVVARAAQELNNKDDNKEDPQGNKEDPGIVAEPSVPSAGAVVAEDNDDNKEDPEGNKEDPGKISTGAEVAEAKDDNKEDPEGNKEDPGIVAGPSVATGDKPPAGAEEDKPPKEPSSEDPRSLGDKPGEEEEKAPEENGKGGIGPADYDISDTSEADGKHSDGGDGGDGKHSDASEPDGKQSDGGDGGAPDQKDSASDQKDSAGGAGIDAAPSPPPPLPYNTAAEFGFTTENTAKFMGLKCLEDVELFVSAFKLNLENTDEDRMATEVCVCVLKLEDKYGERTPESTVFALQQCIHETRKQIKAAYDRRAEVLNHIRQTPKQRDDTRPYPRETFQPQGAQASMQDPLQVAAPGLDPQYILTEDEVNAFMNSHKKSSTCCQHRWLLHVLTSSTVNAAITSVASGSTAAFWEC